MQQVPVSFYRGGLGGAPEPIAAAYRSDPRVEVANALLQQGSDTTPVHGWGEGVVRALAAALGGYWQGENRREYQDRVKAYNDTIGGAVEKGGDFGQVAQALAANPDTAQLGLELRLKQMDSQAQNAGKQARTLTAAEAQQMGLDPAGVYQVDGWGNINAVQKPDKPQIKEIRRGGQIVSVMVDGNGNIVKELGSGPAWKPGPDTVVQAPKTLEERDRQIILQGDPNSPEYAMAYANLFLTPKLVQGTDDQGRPTMTPVMPEVPPNVRKPGYLAGRGQAPQAGAGGAAAAPDIKAQAAADGAIYQGPDGTPQYEDGTPFDPSKPRKAQPAAPAGQPAAAAQSGTPGITVGQPIVTGSAKPNPGMAAEVAKKRTSLGNLESSLKQYENELDAGGTSLLGAAGIPTAANARVSSAYQGLLIEMKNLFELGALSGPDYGIMLQTLTDPNSGKGVTLGVNGLKEQLGIIRDKLASARANLDQQYGPATGAPPAAAGAPPAGQAGKSAASPKSQAEFDALPPGSLYHDPADPPGVVRRKP